MTSDPANGRLLPLRRLIDGNDDPEATSGQHRPQPAGFRKSPAARVVRVLVIGEGACTEKDSPRRCAPSPAWRWSAYCRAPPPDLARLRPDIVVYDVSRSGAIATVVSMLCDPWPTKVIVVAISEHEADLLAYAEAGVSGYVTCEQSVMDVMAAVKAAAQGEMLCSPMIGAALLRHVARLAGRRAPPTPIERQGLTPRELRSPVSSSSPLVAFEPSGRRLAHEPPSVAR